MILSETESVDLVIDGQRLGQIAVADLLPGLVIAWHTLRVAQAWGGKSRLRTPSSVPSSVKTKLSRCSSMSVSSLMHRCPASTRPVSPHPP